MIQIDYELLSSTYRDNGKPIALEYLGPTKEIYYMLSRQFQEVLTGVVQMFIGLIVVERFQ